MSHAVTYIIRQSLHSARKSVWIRLQSAVAVSFVCQPTVVHVDVSIPDVVVTVAHQQVCHLLEKSLTAREKNFGYCGSGRKSPDFI